MTEEAAQKQPLSESWRRSFTEPMDTQISALELVRSIKHDLDGVGFEITPEQIKFDYVVEKNIQLSGLHPFSLLNDKWFINGNNDGGFRTEGSSFVSQWVLSLLLAGETPEAIIATAEDQIVANALEVWEVCKVAGITTAEVMQITEDAWIYPNTELPVAPQGDYVFLDWSMFGRPVRTDTAALVRRFPVSPIYADADQRDFIEEIGKSRIAGYSERHDFRMLLKYALILQGPGPVEMESVYATTAEDNILPVASGVMSTLNSSHIFTNEVPDATATVHFLNQLRNFSKPAAMFLAVERLGRARGGYDAVNKTIDLGMALEIALMHDDQNAKEEITAKTGLRAGWLLGTTPEERLAIKRRTAKIYSARSKAVHTGKAEPKLDINDADALVTSVLKSLLARGAFPDWDTLVFGA